MRLPRRAAILTLAALVALSGCNDKKKRTAEYIAADKAVSGEAPATRFHLATKDATVDLSLPARIDAYPELHRALFDQGKLDLLDFAKTAAEDRKSLAAKGKRQPGVYERQVAWTIATISPNLISLRGKWFSDTGGAHPNHGSSARLWDRLHNQFILPAELFKPDYDFTAQDLALCAAITKVKLIRMGPDAPGKWSCPKWADSRFVPVPSVRPYRMGGVLFLFDPYVIGAYAEGDYEALIPLSDFQAALNPAWAGEFSGSPAPDVKTKP